MQTKKSGSAAANGRKVEKKNAGAKAAGAVKAGAVKAETPKAATVKAESVKCSPAVAKASNAAIKAEAAKIEAAKAENAQAAAKPKSVADEWRELAAALDAYRTAKAKERKAKFAAAAKIAASAKIDNVAAALVQCVSIKERNGGNHAAADSFVEVLAPEAEKRGMVFGTPDKVEPEAGAYVAIKGEKANYCGRVAWIGPKNVRIVTSNGTELTFPRGTVAAAAKIAPKAEKPAQKPAEAAAKPDKPTAQPKAEKPADEPEKRNPFDYSADIAEWRKIAKTNPHEARADIATWASLLPVSDDSNLVFVTCLDTFASVAYLLEKSGRRIVALEKMSDDAAKTFKAELAKSLDAKAAAEIGACL